MQWPKSSNQQKFSKFNTITSNTVPRNNDLN